MSLHPQQTGCRLVMGGQVEHPGPALLVRQAGPRLSQTSPQRPLPQGVDQERQGYPPKDGLAYDVGVYVPEP